jgi:hypothetical protein|tara:strand:- start:1150 stop:1380 length:231 start_codon:yes stop_codon:yes gene_type:complete
VLANYDKIIEQIQAEIKRIREANKKLLLKNSTLQYAENTMYLAGLYKGLSIITDHVRDELNELDKWADDKQNDISA